MSLPVMSRLGLSWVFFSAFLLNCQAGSKAVPSLTASEILERVLERAERARHEHHLLRFEFIRSVVTEELGGDGEVRERKEHRFEMVPQRGALRAKLVETNGRRLSEAQAKAEHEINRRRRAQGLPAPGGKEIALEEDLIERFQFRLLGLESVQGRPAYVLRFDPKDKLPVRQMSDRVINRVSGKVWVDAEEFEIARLNLWLNGKVTLGLGLLGAMHALHIQVERIRLEPGIWLTGTTQGAIRYRQLLNSRFIRWRELNSDFQPVGGEWTATLRTD